MWAGKDSSPTVRHSGNTSGGSISSGWSAAPASRYTPFAPEVRSMPTQNQTEVVLRPATPADAAECGRICYAAFSRINAQHNFPCDFPDAEVAAGIITMLFSAPGVYAVVA